MKTKAFFNWSGGKDSALALYKALKNEKYEIVSLFTSVNADSKRISMHGVSIDLLEKQVENIGLPLKILELPSDVDMAGYEKIMLEKMSEFQNMGINTAIFGDIFLEDVRNYRLEKLVKINMNADFPLWNTPTKEVISEFINFGFKTIVTCINASLLDESFLGRVIDHDFLADLPENVDICGENGEFHTFVFDGPIFQKPVNFTIGEKVYKEYPNPTSDATDKKPYGFWFCDLIKGE